MITTGSSIGSDESYYTLEDKEILAFHELFKYYFENKDAIKKCFRHIGYFSSYPLGSFYVRMDKSRTQRKKMRELAGYLRAYPEREEQNLFSAKNKAPAQASGDEDVLPFLSEAGAVESQMPGVPFAPSASAILPETDSNGSDLGGIDLRSINISSFVVTQGGPEDDEGRDIQNLIRAGIIPSFVRIKDYIEERISKQQFSECISHVRVWMQLILRLEEINGVRLEAFLPDFLGLLENNESEDCIKEYLARLSFSSGV
jgi:hypothetical protein